DEEPPLHPAGERAGAGLALGQEVQGPEDLDELLLLEADAEIAGLIAEGLFDREERVVVDLLRHEPYNLTRLVILAPHVPTQDRGRARGGNHETRDASDERALSRAVRSEQSEDH